MRTVSNINENYDNCLRYGFCNNCDKYDIKQQNSCGYHYEDSINKIKNYVDVMFVGLSAKFDKNKQIIKPLCNSTNTGKIIDKIEEKLSRNRIYYKTNLVKFPPIDNNNKLRHPNKKEMNSCFGYLQSEIQAYKPKIVIMLGEQVSSFIIDALELTNQLIKNVFSKIYLKDGVKFIATHHPSYIYVYKRKIINDYIQEIANLINVRLSLVNQERL